MITLFFYVLHMGTVFDKLRFGKHAWSQQASVCMSCGRSLYSKEELWHKSVL